jgi:hypothetical protein
MARIPDEALERLKREVSLARLIEAQGVKPITAPDKTAQWITEFAQRLGRCSHADSTA